MNWRAMLLACVGLTGFTGVAGAQEAGDPVAEALALLTPAEGFEVLIEAEVPEGFPTPGPVGLVVMKEYPAHRIARAAGRNAFMRLFRHIESNEIPMTTPVEMGMEEDTRGRMVEVDMGFYYTGPDVGEAGDDTGGVVVEDVPARTVLSVGVSGRATRAKMDAALTLLEAELETLAETYEVVGGYMWMGYNSPFVPASRRYHELQVEVSPVPVEDEEASAEETP